MTRKRTSVLVALLALSATGLALAQTAPAPDTMSPSTDTPSAPSEAPAAPAQPSADVKSAQDPKLSTCITTEKAKNSGLSEDQVKQKCMLQIGSHQGH